MNLGRRSMFAMPLAVIATTVPRQPLVLVLSKARTVTLDTTRIEFALPQMVVQLRVVVQANIALDKALIQFGASARRTRELAELHDDLEYWAGES